MSSGSGSCADIPYFFGLWVGFVVCRDYVEVFVELCVGSVVILYSRSPAWSVARHGDI